MAAGNARRFGRNKLEETVGGVRIIRRALEAVPRGEWEDWELAAARSAMRASLQSLGDSQGAMENYYLGQAATGQDESPEELLVLLSEVTPERIRAAAQSGKLDTVYFLKGREN